MTKTLIKSLPQCAEFGKYYVIDKYGLYVFIPHLDNDPVDNSGALVRVSGVRILETSSGPVQIARKIIVLKGVS